ncbi:hypothetical protein T492DRAFT_837792 [Pavlovales sp. CCMP2436]|nr:hypothetical protein T492DRAFT_837792 [Pavlovales sp. CCMP2436]
MAALRKAENSRAKFRTRSARAVSAHAASARVAGWAARDASPPPQSRTRVEDSREANAQACRTRTRKLELLSRLRVHARSPRRPLPSLPRGTTGARGAARGPSMRWRTPTRDAAAFMGLAKHLRACITVARVSFVPYQQTTAEHALLANAAANLSNICIGALACRHVHAPACATAATRRLLRAPPAPPASHSVTCRKTGI